MSGVDGAEAGIFMTPHPHRGPSYRQEDYPGHAEDVFTVVRRGAHVAVPVMDTRHALLTRETTALEPGVVDHKYYVRDIGTVRELTVKGGSESLRLVAAATPVRDPVRAQPPRERREELDRLARRTRTALRVPRLHRLVAHQHRAGLEHAGQPGAGVQRRGTSYDVGQGERAGHAEVVGLDPGGGARGGPVAHRDRGGWF